MAALVVVVAAMKVWAVRAVTAAAAAAAAVKVVARQEVVKELKSQEASSEVVALQVALATEAGS